MKPFRYVGTRWTYVIVEGGGGIAVDALICSNEKW
jgi:hypothetical protein